MKLRANWTNFKDKLFEIDLTDLCVCVKNVDKEKTFRKVFSNASLVQGMFRVCSGYVILGIADPALLVLIGNSPNTVQANQGVPDLTAHCC